MEKYYLIFGADSKGYPILLNITIDYYYFRRLCKRYINEGKSIIKRYCSSFDLLHGSHLF